MKIEAVTFDVSGTLIEPWPSVGHVYAEVAGRHGLKSFSAEQLNVRFKTAWRARKSFEHSRREWVDLVDEVFGLPAANSSNQTFFPALYEKFAEPDAWRIFDDVVPALDALVSKNIRLGIISNWDERLRGLLRGLKLERYFEIVTISCEAGACKPSPIIFGLAATKFRLVPDSILHVGDSFEMDMDGAKAAGFHAVRIHRAAATEPEGAAINSLAHLPVELE